LLVSSAGDVNGDGLDDLIVGAKYADLSDKPNAGKSYVIFGKTGFTKHNIRFTCSRLTTWGTPGTYNQIIQTIAVAFSLTPTISPH
jgi:hypothetical protein